MTRTAFPYSEQVLQWVWNEQLFDTDNLFTECGKQIQILKQGVLNNSDGPDFKDGKIIIGGLEWNGSIELHLVSSGWKQHGHHLDKNYNNVILHVVTENEPSSVLTKSDCTPFTLNLLPHLLPDLNVFLTNIEHSKHLPCSKNLKFISEKVFQEQIKKAHHEYLDKKVNDFLSFYSPDISQSLSWKHALIISIFDGFGISNNRLQMQELAKQLLSKEHQSLKDLQKLATRFAFGSESSIEWNLKGCRPNSHPKSRINTAVQFINFILETPFEEFLSPKAIDLWALWCEKINIHKAGHPKILFATVYLPALYFAGSLYHSHSLTESVKDQWNSYQAPIPPILLSKFKKLDVSSSIYKNKLGAIHQLEHYCTPKKCSECLVLKKVISS